MYLERDQIQLFHEKLYGNQNISKIGINEANNLLKANISLGEENLKDYVYFKNDVIFELNRIYEVIKKYPEVESIYDEINRSVSLNNQVAIGVEDMKEIIRIQAAVGLEINEKYVNAIDSAFNEVYMDLVNDHYEDRYKPDSQKTKTFKL